WQKFRFPKTPSETTHLNPAQSPQCSESITYESDQQISSTNLICRCRKIEGTSRMTGKHRLGLLVIGLTLIRTASGQAADSTPSLNPPPFKQLRYDESYAYLRDSARRSDYLDGLKFIPLDKDGKSYLTLGGEIRERYEYYHNNLWGRGPQDHDGYFLQRYMVHADAHFGNHFRLFTQFKSGLGDGRNGGPRPTDRDDFDLNQAFFDARVPWSQGDSLTFRLGRQELAYGSSRLISVREGPNVRLSFDGAKGILKLSEWQVDAFAVKPVRT